MKLRVQPATQPLSGEYRPPGDKSISQRAVILGALAAGQTRISGFLEAGDTRATVTAIQALGARVRESHGELLIRGGSLKTPGRPLDLGNSGTGMRLLTGALAGRPELFGQEIELTGDVSLVRRPMDRIIEPLATMGATIESRGGRAPLLIRPRPLTGRRHQLKIASAQVKSALLLAGLNAHGETSVIEPAPTRDHTERLLPAFGVRLETAPGMASLSGGQSLSGTAVQVPGDLSAAAFILAAALLVPGSRVAIEPVGLNPTRDGILRVLARAAPAGCLQVAQNPGSRAGFEPAGTIRVHHGRLRGIAIPAEWVPLGIDEFPVIMALAAAADGETVITGAAELRVKESDRLAVMCRQLARLGVVVRETADGAVILGGPVAGGEVDAAGDHRIAMSLAVLGLVAEAEVVIDGAEWIETSYPGFVADLRALGAEIGIEET